MPDDIEIIVKPDLSGLEEVARAFLEIGQAVSRASEVLLAFYGTVSAAESATVSAAESAGQDEMRSVPDDVPDIPAVRLASRTRTTVPGQSAGQ